MPKPEELKELCDQVEKAIKCHHRSCLVCFHYVLTEKSTIVKCTERVRVWEYSTRLSPTHEIKCIHRARNCHTYSPEDARSVRSLTW